MPTDHPTDAELQQFASGELADARFEEVAAHLETCEQCGEFLRTPGAFPKLAEGDQATEVRPSITECPGSVIGPYKLLQQLGEGGMGVVYMAEQEMPVRRVVALKIIKPGMDSSQVIARFEAERQALAMMDHHHIAKVLDAGTTDTGRPYFAMELVKGVPITEYCDRNKLNPRERLEMFIPVCQAIQHAHQKGIIHRDIKPSNVLVTLYDGKPVPKVIDFGIAKATQQKLTERTMFTGIGQILGTLEYMSPEQAEMNQLDVDTRTDIYSLGVMLYELLTGSTPITKDKLRNVGLEEMLRTIRETEPPKPSTRLSDSGEALPSISAVRKTEPAKLSKLVRGDLDWIVMRALEKDRTRRYETANGLAMDVQRYLSDDAVEACPPSAGYRFRKFARRNKAALVTGIAIAGILIAATVVSSSLAVWARRAERVASANEIKATEAATAEKTARDEEKRQRELAMANAEKAMREATKSTAVATFLKDMLNGVGPSVALGRDTEMLQEILDKTVSRLQTDLADQPEVQAEVRMTIGGVYEQFWKYSQAEVQYREALRLYREVHDEVPHETVADTLQRLAQLPEVPDQMAVDLLNESLHIWQSLKGEEDISTVSVMRSLADRQKYSPASLTNLQRSLSILENAPGDNDVKIAETLSELALAKRREPASAAEIPALLNRAVSLARSRVGQDFRRAEAFALHAKSLTSDDDEELQSLEFARQAVEAVERLEDGQVAAFDFLVNLARKQWNAAHYRDSKSTVERILQKAGQYFDGDSRRTAQLYIDCSDMLYSLGYPNQARQVQDRALEILGPNRHSDVHPYSDWLDRHDPRVADRIQRHRKLDWEYKKKVQGVTSWDTLTSGDLYATAFFQAGRLNEGLDILNQAYVASNRHWQYVTAPNLLANQRHRNITIYTRALEVAEQIDPDQVGAGDVRDNAWIKEDAARAILVDTEASEDTIRRAIVQAEQANRRGRGEGLCLALARYRQGRYAEVAELLEPSLGSPRYRAISLTLAALSALQLGRETQANEFVDELGLLSTARITMPEHFVLAMKENAFIAFFMQVELQGLSGFPRDATDAERIDVGLERYARFVNRHADNHVLKGRLARYYVWFRKNEFHKKLCERLIAEALESDSHRNNNFITMAFLSAPSDHADLIRDARLINERAVDSVDTQDLHSHHETTYFAQYLMACALAEYRLGDFESARVRIDQSEQYVVGLQRGTWGAIKALNCVRMGRIEDARKALAVAEELIWPGPSRDHLDFEMVDHIDPPDTLRDEHPSHDQLLNWMVLEEATTAVTTAEIEVLNNASRTN